jgi:pterin-4a-carbinolamine dehydratase
VDFLCPVGIYGIMVKSSLQTNKKQIQDSWEEVNGKLIRTFYFKNNKEVSDFTVKVLSITEKYRYEPTIISNTDNVKISLLLNEQVSEKCHKFALAIDKILE